jgi:HEAT repeat protein
MRDVRRLSERIALDYVDDLRLAIAHNDPVALEEALTSACARASEDPRVVPILCELLSLDWHQEHEELASFLQQQRDARAVEALARAAGLKLGYLSYNNSYAFARKCVWALADIGTPDAKQRLVELAESDDPEIASYAKRRLERWGEELHRKASTRRE